MSKSGVLTENDVVQAVAAHLEASGYRIDGTCSTDERGVDIVAVNRATGQRLLVEAKGGTSLKATSSRFGSPFTANQARSHVSVAFYSAAKLRQQHMAEGTCIALAFPDDRSHRKLVDGIRSALDVLDITVFFVNAIRLVTAQPS